MNSQVIYEISLTGIYPMWQCSTRSLLPPICWLWLFPQQTWFDPFLPLVKLVGRATFRTGKMPSTSSSWNFEILYQEALVEYRPTSRKNLNLTHVTVCTKWYFWQKHSTEFNDVEGLPLHPYLPVPENTLLGPHGTRWLTRILYIRLHTPMLAIVLLWVDHNPKERGLIA